MSRVRISMSTSLDGYVAGPGQDLEHPLGIGGDRLHEWAFATAAFRDGHGDEADDPDAGGVDDEVAAGQLAGVGATVMGRRMFGGGPGPWSEDPSTGLPWRGWWGDDPPYHHPVFVLTHHAREPLVMDGGTTFVFVTDGFDTALAQARAASGEQDVLVGGGADVARQALRAGVVDEVLLSVVPVLLGSGERLLGDLGGLPGYRAEPVVSSPAVAHLRLRRVDAGD